MFDFYQQLNEAGCVLTREVQTPFETGNSVWSELGPWTFSSWRENYPDLTLGEEYVLTDPPVPDDAAEGEPVYTFADAKGTQSRVELQVPVAATAPGGATSPGGQSGHGAHKH